MNNLSNPVRAEVSKPLFRVVHPSIPQGKRATLISAGSIIVLDSRCRGNDSFIFFVQMLLQSMDQILRQLRL